MVVEGGVAVSYERGTPVTQAGLGRRPRYRVESSAPLVSQSPRAAARSVPAPAGSPPKVWAPSRVVDRIAQALRFRGCGLRLRLPGFGLRGSGFGGWGLGGLPREPRRRGPKPFLDPQLSDLRERPA